MRPAGFATGLRLVGDSSSPAPAGPLGFGRLGQFRFGLEKGGAIEFERHHGPRRYRACPLTLRSGRHLALAWEERLALTPARADRVAPPSASGSLGQFVADSFGIGF
jgi:hypothetical protein